MENKKRNFRNNPIIVTYYNLDKLDITEYYEFNNKLRNNINNVLPIEYVHINVPVRNQETRVEILNPVLVSENETEDDNTEELSLTAYIHVSNEDDIEFFKKLVYSNLNYLTEDITILITSNENEQRIICNNPKPVSLDEYQNIQENVIVVEKTLNEFLNTQLV